VYEELLEFAILGIGEVILPFLSRWWFIAVHVYCIAPNLPALAGTPAL